MKPEKSRLIHELLEEHHQPARREAALLAGRRALRHKRWRRTALRAGMLAAVLTLTAIPVHYWMVHRPQALSVARAPKPAARDLTDDQLLALFPNTPVGLAKIDGRKVLIFPRASDRQRFVGTF